CGRAKAYARGAAAVSFGTLPRVILTLGRSLSGRLSPSWLRRPSKRPSRDGHATRVRNEIRSTRRGRLVRHAPSGHPDPRSLVVRPPLAVLASAAFQTALTRRPRHPCPE